MNELNDQYAKENALSSSMGCFIKGTLVETEEGWTPIDELKVGDWVMSRPENGIGEAVPKRVVNTFRYEDKEVWNLEFSTFPRRGGSGARLSATPDQPFCVYGVVTNLFMDSQFGVLGREDSIYTTMSMSRTTKTGMRNSKPWNVSVKPRMKSRYMKTRLEAGGSA